MKQILIIVSLFITVHCCLMGNSIDGWRPPNGLYCYNDAAVDTGSDFWVNIRKRRGNVKKTLNNNQFVQENVAVQEDALDQIKYWFSSWVATIKSGFVFLIDVAISIQNRISVGLGHLKDYIAGNKHTEEPEQIPELYDDEEELMLLSGDEQEDEDIATFDQDYPEEELELQGSEKENPEKSFDSEIFIAQVKDALQDAVNTSIADVREQAKMVSQDVKDALRNVVETTVADTRRQVQQTANEVSDLLKKAAEQTENMRAIVAEKEVEAVPELFVVPNLPTKETQEMPPPPKKEEETPVIVIEEQQSLKETQKPIEKPIEAENNDDSLSRKFEEFLNYKVGKSKKFAPSTYQVAPYMNLQNPYYQPTGFPYQGQQAPQMMPMHYMPVATPMYQQPSQQLSAVAMQLQASAMAMQSQASALMMQAQQPHPYMYPMQPYQVFPQTPVAMTPQLPLQQQTQDSDISSYIQKLKKKGKAGQLSKRCQQSGDNERISSSIQELTKQVRTEPLKQKLQQLGKSGGEDIQRTMLLLDLESDIIEHLLAGNTGQIVDRVVQKRNMVLKKSNNLVKTVYNMIMDLAIASAGNDSDQYNHYVRRSRREKPLTGNAYQAKKKFLMRIMYVLEHYYEMIKKMQKIYFLADSLN